MLEKYNIQLILGKNTKENWLGENFMSIRRLLNISEHNKNNAFCCTEL